MTELDRARERLAKAEEQLGRNPWRPSAQEECWLARRHLARVQRETEAQEGQGVLFEEQG